MVELRLCAIESHPCQGLQRLRTTEYQQENSGQEEGSKGGPRVVGRPDGSPHCPARRRHWMSTCCSEQVAGLRGDATLHSCVRIVPPLKLTHGTTKMTVLSPSNCVISLFQQGFHPKIEWRVLEKSHILHFSFPQPWKLKQNMPPPFKKKIILSALWGPNTPWGTLLTPEHMKLSFYTGIYWGPVAQGWGAGEQGYFGSSHKMVLYYLVLFPPHTH